MESTEAPPYEDIERLCRLLGVPFQLYDLKGSIRRCITAVQLLQSRPVGVEGGR